MMDISRILTSTMKDKQCSSLCAFLLLEAGERDGVHLYQSKPIKQSDGRLRDTRNKSIDEAGLGNSIYEHSSTRIHDARHAIF